MDSGSKPDTLYHYCSVETFYNIIKYKTLRLSDISQSNDSMELNWTLKIANEMLDVVHKESIEEGLNPKYCDAALGCVQRELNVFPPIVFICCFSQLGDLLSQWRAYADDGKGMAIGFNPNILPSDSNLRWKIVEYNNTEQISFIYNTIKNMFKNNQEEDFPLFPAYDCVQEILQHSTFYKNASFREEHEYRLIYQNTLRTQPFHYVKEGWAKVALEDLNRFKKKITASNYDLLSINYHSKLGRLIPFIDLYFNAIKDDFITEIVIGPKCQLSKAQISAFLFYNDFPFDIEVTKSSSTYR